MLCALFELVIVRRHFGFAFVYQEWSLAQFDTCLQSYAADPLPIGSFPPLLFIQLARFTTVADHMGKICMQKLDVDIVNVPAELDLEQLRAGANYAVDGAQAHKHFCVTLNSAFTKSNHCHRWLSY